MTRNSKLPGIRSVPWSQTESALIREGERRALQIFHRATAEIPAYKKFLKKNGVRPQAIKTAEDFSKLPETDKKTYIRAYSAEERSPRGSFSSQRIIAASSGTTGAPTLWPRGAEQEAEAAAVHEFLFSSLYEINRYKTLLVIGFPMGIYVSGIATALPSYAASLKHPNLTILTAGNNKESVLGILPSLQNHFDQIIFAGHPFFVKDIIESGPKAGVQWKKNKIRTFFVSEGFSEAWRDYVASRLPNALPERDLFSHYGSSEFLLMGYESPESIAVRKAAEKHASFRKSLFGDSVPSLFHYNPAIRYFESNAKKELLATAWSGIPLIRYNMHDTGSLLRHSDISAALTEARIPLTAVHAERWKPWPMPFVTLEGRSDYALVFYAVNIYPDQVRRALENKKFLGKLSGKFTLEKIHVRGHEQQLAVHLELSEGLRMNASFARAVQEHVYKGLRTSNLEYRDASEKLGKDLKPKIFLHQFRDPDYFPVGLKPRFIKNEK